MNTVDEIKKEIRKCTGDDFTVPLECISSANGELSQKEKTVLLKLMTDGDVVKRLRLNKQLSEIKHPNVERPEYINNYVFVGEHGCYYSVITLTPLIEKSLNTMFDGLKIEINGDAKFLTPSKAFKYLKGICVDTISWQPVPYGEKPTSIHEMENGATFLNRYRPPNRQPMKGSVKLFLDLVEFLVPNKTERELLLNWMAFTLRYPNIKINWQILFIGNPRIGKDAIFAPLFKILGSSSGEAKNSELEETSFNDYLIDTKFLTIQEIHYPHNKKVQALIKVYTASTAGGSLRINPKYGRKIETPNLLSVVAFSNFDDAIQMDKDDDRFLVFNARVTRKADSYYTKYFNWLNSDNGIEKIMHFLLKRNIKNFNYGALPIRTEAYYNLVKEGQPLWIQDLQTRLDDEQPPFHNDPTTVKRVTKFVNNTMTKNKFVVAEKTISNKLTEFGYKKLREACSKKKKKKWSTPHLWARGELFNELNKKTSAQLFEYFYENNTNFKAEMIRAWSTKDE